MDLLSPIKKRLAYQYCWAVEAHESISNSWEFRVLKLVQRKGKLDLEERSAAITGIDALLEAVPADEPTVLVITGRGVISKKLEGNNLSEAHCVGSLLQSARASDFMLQRHTVPGGLIASIIRKSHAEGLLDTLRRARIQITDVALGGTILTGLHPLIDPNLELLKIGPYELVFKGEELIDYRTLRESTNDSFRIGSEYVEAQFLPALAMGLAYFTTASELEPIQEQPSARAREELLYKKVFQLSGWVVLLTLLGTLTANFLVRSHYAEKVDTLSYHLATSESNTEEVERIAQEIQEKQALLETYRIANQARTAFYADRLAETLPGPVLLSELNIHPEIAKRKRTDKTTFRQDKIEVHGFTPRSTVLNTWIQELMNEDWVDDILIRDYTRDPKKKHGVFSLEIRTNGAAA